MFDINDVSWKSVPFNSPEYQQTIDLRFEVLRKPLGLKFSQEQLGKEANYTHFAGFDKQNKVVACLVLAPISNDTVQMKQVAVLPALQGNQLGKILVKNAENIASNQNFKKIVLHARINVVAFYLKLGYNSSGLPFEEIGIMHQKMEKQLNDFY